MTRPRGTPFAPREPGVRDVRAVRAGPRAPHVVAAPDKFRGTASAAEAAGAIAEGARRCGWSADEVPLADGGEGTIEAVAAGGRGTLRRARVHGPLGAPVGATWLVLDDTAGLPLPAPLVPGEDPTALIEASSAAGRSLLPRPRGTDPLRASTQGVGELLLAAARAGARQAVVAVGGTATTDGGAGARAVARAAGGIGGLRLVVACDVATRFLSAAKLFGPQKGAGPSQVVRLTDRLESLADRYLAEDGLDVRQLDGSGAGGGLAGGLATLGATLVPGFPFVAALVDLERRLGSADLVVTGEGRLDPTSFEGKVVGGVLGAGGGLAPALCVVGEATPGASLGWSGRRGPVELVELVQVVGAHRAWHDVAAALRETVASHCSRA